MRKENVWDLAEISFTERNWSVQNNIYPFLVVVLQVPWVAWDGKFSFSGCWATSLAWAKDLQVMTPPLCEQWDALGHLPTDPFSLGILLALTSIPPARAGGAEHPAGICGSILFLLHSHNPIRASGMSSVKYTEVVTTPCGVCLALERPELMKAAFPEIYVYQSQTLPQSKNTDECFLSFLCPIMCHTCSFIIFFF